MPESKGQSRAESVLAHARAVRARSAELLSRAAALRRHADQVRCDIAVLRGRVIASLEPRPAERGESRDVER